MCIRNIKDFEMNTIIENNKIWQNAVMLSVKAHRFQTRKDGVTPYVSHPMRVCLALSLIFDVHDPEILSAALLHDVIEDTNVDFDDILEACGREVASTVALLSKDTRMEYEQREAMYKEQLASASWKVKLIKIADIYDNICDALVSRLGINVWTPALNMIEDATGIPELCKAIEIISDLLKSLGAEKEWLDGTSRIGSI